MEDDGKLVLSFKSRDELVRVDCSRLAYFSADGNFTDVVFINGVRTKISASMASIEKLISEQLDGRPNPYIRIGRSLIVNSKFIFKIDMMKRQLTITDLLHSGVYTLNVSKDALRLLKEQLDAK